MMRSTTTFLLFAIIISILLSSSSFFAHAQSSSSCSIPVTQSYSNLSISTINKILELHNDARRATTPLATNMKMLTWNDQLSFAAEDFLKTCAGLNKHSSQQYRENLAGFSYVGENLGATSSTTFTENEFAMFVGMWNDEKDYWTHQPAPCGTAAVCGNCAVNPDIGQPMCGHYTQNVWAGTTQIGCAFYNGCSYGTMYACHYGSGGNLRGQEVFAASSSSSAPVPPCESAVPHTIVSRSSASASATSSPTGGSATNSPGGNTNSPGGSATNSPGGNTNSPGGSATNSPGGNTNSPGGNTNSPGGNTNSPGGSPSSPNGSPNSSPSDDGGNSGGLLTGEIVGIVVGSICAVLLIGAVVFFVMRRARQRQSWESGEGVAQNYLFAQPAAAPKGGGADEELVVGLRENGALGHNQITDI